MADDSSFGGDSIPAPGTFGSGLSSDMVGGVAPDARATQPNTGNAGDSPGAAPSAPPAPGQSFGSSLRSILPGPHYNAPDPAMSALDQSADMLQQRIARANAVATNPLLQFFNPEGVQKARDFAPAAAEKLQQIRTQQAAIVAGKQQAATLGLAPGEAPDEATEADRVAMSQAKALKGDLTAFKGLSAVKPEAAAAIQDQVHEAVSGHITKAQYAFDSLSGMTNPGQYAAKVNELRKDGALADLEALGLKVPGSFDQFNAGKGREGQALREARQASENLKAKLEERAGGVPMEEKEQKTYAGRLTTESGQEINNGTWSRINGKRVFTVNGMGDVNDLGKKYTFASPDQRKAFHEDTKAAVPEKEIEKVRDFNRTRTLAVTDAKGNFIPPEGAVDAKGKRIFMNTNPNVQQGIAEGLASMLRGGTGGATSGLLNIETGKRGYVQGAIDKIITNYAGAINTLTADQVKPYLSELTQDQMRSVLDGLHEYSGKSISDRTTQIARRAGELGLDASALGFGKGEVKGIDDAINEGRQSTIDRFKARARSTSGGDGGIYLDNPPPMLVTDPDHPPGSVPPVPPPVGTNGPQAPPPPGAPPGGGAPPAAINPAPTAGGGQPPSGGPAPAAPVQQTIAGQPVNVTMPPGASPNYVKATQRIESGNEKDPWKAGAKGTSASGAFQFTNGTWAANKPAGAPDRAGDATPAQQAEGFAKLTQHNADKLTAAGLPVDDVNLYVTHNLGEAGGPRLLKANPDADARTVVGEVAAKNNPLFFRGRPTVAVALERYRTEMAKGGLTAPADDTDPNKPQPSAGGAAAEAPSLLKRISRALTQGVAGSGADKDKAVADVGNAAVEHAPAIGSTFGAIGGSVAGPAGAVAGGGAGGAAGQSLKDYLQGRPQNPTEIAKQGALGAVLGVASEAQPVLAAGARALGSGAVEAGAKVAEGGDAVDAGEAGLKGVANAAGGELFGRSLGMIGHKVWNMFAPDAKAAVREAAATYSTAEATLAKESPKLPGVGGAAGGPNPAYEAAEAAKAKAETVLKDAGLKPEEAAYAHKVSSEGVPKQEAEASRPGALEGQRVGEGYQQLESEVGAAGKGAPKATPKLADGPRAAVDNKEVSAKHAELAERVEAAITAPAPDWKTKWTQLKDARSQLLQAERDALTSTSPGRTREAADMRKLADTVRVQQAKAAKYVFGEKDGEAFMGRLKVLDVRYRNLMEATNSGDLARAAALKGEAGRDAERKFVAFAHDDPQAIAAYRAMRKGGSNVENDVRTLVGMEKVPYLGHVVTWAKMAGRMREWAQERAAGNPVSFSDLVKTPGFFESNKPVRDLLGTVAQRGAAQ